MKWQKITTDYLTFTRKDRIGILIVVCLIGFIILAPGFLGKNPPPSTLADTAWIAALKKLEIQQPDKYYTDDNNKNENISVYQYDRSEDSYTTAINKKLFFFDPNSISTQDWRKLGLRDKIINTIQNFISKGGHFYNPEDLKKIYGLREEEYERLAPYVQIKPKTTFEKADQKETKLLVASININTADTSSLIELPGIGSKLATRIINFRNSLGGFYSIEQIREVYGLPDSTFEKIKPRLKLENGTIKKININTATIDELKAHPYIKYGLANPIIAYREQHGVFSKIEDIKKIMVITEEIYNKISPYLTL